MKKAFSRLFTVLLALCLVFGTAFSVSASAPTDAYTYWTNVGTQRKAVYAKSMYDVETTIDVTELGVAQLTQITCICTDPDGNLYILDTSSRVVVLDNEYNLLAEFGDLINPADETTVNYKDAKGIYYSDGYIYICNTQNKNILLTNLQGELVNTITLPDSELIPEDFIFKPTKVARDSNGYLYVASEGCYYGALLYSPDGEFLGFYGSNVVAATLESVLTNISNRLFPNAAKHANSIKKLPYSFVDIIVDNEDFIYTCNGYTTLSTDARNAQIRKLSPGTGTNILNSGVNFTDTEVIWIDGFHKQDICDIEVDSRGFIYALESQFDKIFIYDSDCRVLNVFAGGMGSGEQKGTFANSVSMALKDDGDRILVADSNTNFITVFSANDYGKEVKRLDYLTLNGDYDLVKEGWLEVLKQDANSQVAYSGIANAYLEEENYEMALKYAKLGYDKDTYAVAFEYVRKDFISDNFTWIFIVIVVLVIGIIALMFITNKKKIVFIKNKTLNLMLTTAIHPSNNFTDIKEKHLGSVPLSILLIVLYYVVTVLKTIAGGFLFSNFDPETFNSLFVLIRSAGLVVLWIVANWLVSTLLGGKGKLKEITIVTCYSLLPMIVEGVIYIILSNVLLPSEATFLSILSTIAFMYFILMLVIGMLKIHDYTMGKFLWTAVLSILGMAVIIFLIIMLIILIQQFGAFVLTLITELSTI